MIKINLLPSHILESRHVKALLRWIVVGLAGITLLLAGYVWGPASICLGPRQKAAQKRLDDATAQWQEVQALQNETQRLTGQYAEMGQWVAWVAEADAKPAQWNAWFDLLRKYVPADVVVNGFPNPGTSLTLTGYTSDWGAACRWYLNMLRCEMLDGPPESVRFSTPYTGWPAGGPRGSDPMGQQVTISLPISSGYLTMLNPASIPATAGVSGGRTSRASGGRMGAGRGARGGRRGQSG